MAPEQARGRPVDRRVDAWAFGCVLYECLTGRRAFDGETVGDVLAAVLEKEPDWSALPAATPARLRELLEGCLRKDPRRRVRDLGDARVLLEDIASGAIADPPATRSSGRRPLVAVLAATTALALVWMRAGDRARSVTARRLTSAIGLEVFAGWSPESELLAFSRMADESLDFYVMPAAGGTARALVAGPGDEIAPRWSPDGRHLVYVSTSESRAVVRLVPRHGGASCELVPTYVPPLDILTLRYLMGDRPWASDGESLLTGLALPGGQVAIHSVDRNMGTAEQVTFPPPAASISRRFIASTGSRSSSSDARTAAERSGRCRRTGASRVRSWSTRSTTRNRRGVRTGGASSSPRTVEDPSSTSGRSTSRPARPAS